MHLYAECASQLLMPICQDMYLGTDIRNNCSSRKNGHAILLGVQTGLVDVENGKIARSNANTPPQRESDEYRLHPLASFIHYYERFRRM